MSKNANRELWRSRVESQRASGFSRRKWCDENNINFNTLAYWIGRFNKEKKESEQTETKWATVIPDKKQNKAITSQLSVSIGKAIVDVPSNSCMESFEKIVQVLVKYV
ncbi:MAG: hypothetical protein JEZ05_11160 [Tenericutes bacterium]|nr:hypothetical protein [Mycoplasmatota bacterium]